MVRGRVAGLPTRNWRWLSKRRLRLKRNLILPNLRVIKGEKIKRKKKGNKRCRRSSKCPKSEKMSARGALRLKICSMSLKMRLNMKRMGPVILKCSKLHHSPKRNRSRKRISHSISLNHPSSKRCLKLAKSLKMKFKMEIRVPTECLRWSILRFSNLFLKNWIHRVIKLIKIGPPQPQRRSTRPQNVRDQNLIRNNLKRRKRSQRRRLCKRRKLV